MIYRVLLSHRYDLPCITVLVDVSMYWTADRNWHTKLNYADFTWSGKC